MPGRLAGLARRGSARCCRAMDWYALTKPLLFQLPPETAHHATIDLLAAGLGPRVAVPTDPRLRVSLGALHMPHPVGLAAGMDKDAEAELISWWRDRAGE